MLSFFQKRPIMILYALLAVATVAFGLHYRGILKDVVQLRESNATLKTALEVQQGATDAAVSRAEEIASDLAQFGLTIEGLEEVGRNVRAENRRLRLRIDSLELSRLVDEQPEVAGDTATSEFNDALRLLECETDPDRIGTCGAAGEDAAASTAP